MWRGYIYILKGKFLRRTGVVNSLHGVNTLLRGRGRGVWITCWLLTGTDVLRSLQQRVKKNKLIDLRETTANCQTRHPASVQWVGWPTSATSLLRRPPKGFRLFQRRRGMAEETAGGDRGLLIRLGRCSLRTTANPCHQPWREAVNRTLWIPDTYRLDSITYDITVCLRNKVIRIDDRIYCARSFVGGFGESCTIVHSTASRLANGFSNVL